jgi:hypothetical protein
VLGEDGKKGMENALRANTQGLREQYEQLKDLHEAYGEAMLESRARKKLQTYRLRRFTQSSTHSVSVAGVAEREANAR